MFHTAYTFGRFNIPHNGHLALFREMAELADNVVIGVSAGRNNLPIEHRLEALRRLFPQGNFVAVRSAFELELPSSSEEVVGVFGQDQAAFADTLANHHGGTTFILPRSEEQPSSTNCRKAFASEDVEALVDLMPSNFIEVGYQLYSLEVSANA